MLGVLAGSSAVSLGTAHRGRHTHCAPVACAHQGDGQCHTGQGDQLIHGECDGFVHEAVDGQAVRGPVDLGHCAVVADVVQGGGCDETGGHQGIHGGLTVERVPAWVCRSTHRVWQGVARCWAQSVTLERCAASARGLLLAQQAPQEHKPTCQ